MPFPTSGCVRAGRFGDIRPIGQGAWGQVYAAKDNLGRAVAVKEALPSQQEFQNLRAKFRNEARIQAALQHPNIVAVHQLEEDPQTQELYLVCEYANGGSLADHLQACGSVTEPQALTIALDLCAALAAIWRLQIVHRDLKPSNVLLFKDARGQIATAKLGDFGVAQDQKRRRTTLLPGVSHPGTPLYMPPEQAQIANVLDVRADLYALGITLWEMLTGHDYKLLAAGDPRDMADRRNAISAGMAAIIGRAVEDDRARRYQTPQEMARELEEVRDGTWVPVRSTIALRAAPAIMASRPPTEPPTRLREEIEMDMALAPPQHDPSASDPPAHQLAAGRNQDDARGVPLNSAAVSSIAFIVSAALWLTIERPEQSVSLSLALGAVIFVMALARWRRGTSFIRSLQLGVSGFSSVIGIACAFGSTIVPFQFFGLLVAFASLVAIGLTLAQDGKT